MTQIIPQRLTNSTNHVDRMHIHLVVLTLVFFSFYFGDCRTRGIAFAYDAWFHDRRSPERRNVSLSMEHNSETLSLSCSLSEIADRTLIRQTVDKLMKKLKKYRFCIYVRSSKNAPICSLVTVNWWANRYPVDSNAYLSGVFIPRCTTNSPTLTPRKVVCCRAIEVD